MLDKLSLEKSKMRRFTNCCVIAAVALSVAGCRKEPAAGAANAWIDPSVTRFHALGWLGGRAHPATRTVETTDKEGAEIAVGGMVVTEVDSDGPLAAAGVRRGDVIVRVGSTWLPIKDDPSLDFIRAVESEVSARVQPIQLGVLRKGSVEELELAHDMDPMEVGLPATSERLEAIAQAGLRKLVELHRQVVVSTDSLRLDAMLHTAEGKLWVDWKHDDQEFGCAELDDQDWGPPAFEPWTDPAWVGEESIRKSIQQQMMGD